MDGLAQQGLQVVEELAGVIGVAEREETVALADEVAPFNQGQQLATRGFTRDLSDFGQAERVQAATAAESAAGTWSISTREWPVVGMPAVS